MISLNSRHKRLSTISATPHCAKLFRQTTHLALSGASACRESLPSHRPPMERGLHGSPATLVRCPSRPNSQAGKNGKRGRSLPAHWASGSARQTYTFKALLEPHRDSIYALSPNTRNMGIRLVGHTVTRCVVCSITVHPFALSAELNTAPCTTSSQERQNSILWGAFKSRWT